MKFLELFSTSEPILLFLTEKLAEVTLVKFLQEIGAVTYPDEGFVGRFSIRLNHLWINLCDGELTYLSGEQVKQIQQLIGGEPRSCLVLELSSGEDASDLAINFLKKLSQKWLCVLYAPISNTKFYAVSEVIN